MGPIAEKGSRGPGVLNLSCLEIDERSADSASQQRACKLCHFTCSCSSLRSSNWRTEHRDGPQIPEQGLSGYRYAPCVEAFRRFVLGAQALCGKDLRLDRSHDVLGNLVLDCEYIADCAIIALGPDVRAGCGVD
jgi:hypothetical protein